ncbi:MAG: mandelate racemase/muconate lactonizing enzyme family protein [Nocardioidaceae bacterium]
MSGHPGSLPVERVRVTILRAPIDDSVPMSFGRLDARQTCIVEVAAGGLHGVGESWINYPAWAPAERMATLCRGVAPLLIGMDASRPADVLSDLGDALLPIGRQCGAPGPIWQALSGVDVALWDIAAQATGLSVAALLAEETPSRSHIPAYASGVGPTDVRLLCERALAHGYTAVKTKVGFGPDRDDRTLSDARSVLGESRGLFADANQAWDLTEAMAMLPTLAAHHVGWLEEPLAGDRLDELEKIAAHGEIPIATGENLYGTEELDRYALSGAIRVLQPDIGKAGGLTVASHVARTVSGAGTNVAPHCYSSAVGLAASVHLGAAHEAVSWLELDVRDNPLRTELLSTPLEWSAGSVQVPTGPGLGIALDPAAVQRFRTHHEEVTPHDC